MYIKAYKIYGVLGHRQGESFYPSYDWEFTDAEYGMRQIRVLNSDKTGTNDYTIVIVTRNTEFECDKEILGQLSDGIFENHRVGKLEVLDTVEDLMLIVK